MNILREKDLCGNRYERDLERINGHPWAKKSGARRLTSSECSAYYCFYLHASRSRSQTNPTI